MNQQPAVLHVNRTYRLTSIVILMGAMLVSISCRREIKLHSDAVSDRAAIPVLEAHDVATLISDSGITRYRITAPSWMMYDKADPSYWEFVDGIYLEKFDEDLSVDASLKADYAHYNEPAEIWHLTGNVHAVNQSGEVFDTPELYWDQRSERIYSDSMIVIHRQTSILQGIGFQSNQQMTKYTILNPTGIFPIEEEEE